MVGPGEYDEGNSAELPLVNARCKSMDIGVYGSICFLFFLALFLQLQFYLLSMFLFFFSPIVLSI